MPYLPYPQPRSKYCRKHGREYHGYMCPECAKEAEASEVERRNKANQLLDKLQQIRDRYRKEHND